MRRYQYGFRLFDSAPPIFPPGGLSPLPPGAPPPFGFPVPDPLAALKRLLAMQQAMRNAGNAPKIGGAAPPGAPMAEAAPGGEQQVPPIQPPQVPIPVYPDPYQGLPPIPNQQGYAFY